MIATRPPEPRLAPTTSAGHHPHVIDVVRRDPTDLRSVAEYEAGTQLLTLPAGR